MNLADWTLAFRRRTEIFTRQSDRVEGLARKSLVIQLAPDQIFHLETNREYLVRRGKLRVSQFLDDGREVTRAVLQAGSILMVTPTGDHGDNPAADLYNLPDMVLMALGESELWSLPPGSLETES